MATVLIAEDNKNTQLLTAVRLKPHFNVMTADDGLEALDIIYDKHVDIVIADIMMPNMDGYELLKRLRKERFTVPVLLLTAKQRFEDKREGFDSGSDDYMTKPVNYDELLLRINALLRRAGIASNRKITVGSALIDSAAYTVKSDKLSLELPKKEFEILYKLLSYPGIIFTKNQLLNEVWGYDSESTEDTVKTHISRLRSKLRDFSEFEVVTVKGLGYKAEIKGGS